MITTLIIVLLSFSSITDSLEQFKVVNVRTHHDSIDIVHGTAETLKSTQNPQILEFFAKFQHLFTTPNVLFKGLLQLVEQDEGHISTKCKLHIQEASKRIFNEIWPIQMLDAWGKFPEGLLSGHFGMIGDFHECMRLNAEIILASNSSESIKGRYCPMHFVLADENSYPTLDQKKEEDIVNQEPNRPLYPTFQEINLFLTQPTLGVCLPSSCTRDDFNLLFGTVVKNLTGGIASPITSYCRTTEKPSFDPAAIAMICAIVIVILLNCIGTLVDMCFADTRMDSLKKVLLGFSLSRNYHKLFHVDESSREDLSCLHGLRFLSICWIVLIHSLSVFTTYTPLWNRFTINGFHEPWTMLLVANGTFSVDTFFTISGFLLTWQMLKQLDKKSFGIAGILKMYLQRYLRLTPTYAFLLGFIATLQPYLSNGPNWSLIEMNGKYCRRNWWENLLYVNNLLSHNTEEDPTDVPCFGEAWYLGCDMQFFLVSVWVVYIISRNRKFGLTLLSFLTIASIATPTAITGAKNLLPLSIPFRPPPIDTKGNYDLDIYVKPWTRIGSYLTGIWSGYFFYLTRNRLMGRLSSTYGGIGWVLTITLILTIIFGPIKFFDLSSTITPIESILYGGFCRFCWGVAIGYIIFSCLTGRGGSINRILSMKIFVPLGRITFAVFLCSYELQQLFHARYPHPLSYDIYLLVNLFFAHLSISVIVGFVVTIFIEMPFVNIGKLLLK